MSISSIRGGRRFGAAKAARPAGPPVSASAAARRAAAFTVERQAGDVKFIFVGRLRLANILRGKADLDIVHLLFTLSRRVSAVFSTGPND